MHKKTVLRKIWHFIWEDNSIWSWLVNIVLAYVLIKFIFYPGIGFALATDYPAVAVVSCSMEHKPDNCWVDCYNRGGSWQGCMDNSFVMCGSSFDDKKMRDFDGFWEDCGKWYEDREISKEEFRGFDFKNGFNMGDIFIVSGRSDVIKGDIIVFYYGGESNPIIHRVVDITNDNGEIYYQTKGDHNSGASVFEQKINKEKVYGKAIVKIPFLGWVKIWFTTLLRGI